MNLAIIVCSDGKSQFTTLMNREWRQLMSDYSVIKGQLQAKLAELEERARKIEYRLSDPGSPDWEENAALHANDEVLSTLGDLSEHDMHEIRQAIHRIESGTYGICVHCEKKIPAARLSALPFTSTCVNCA
jgi:DnaK suppressor protein